MLLTTLVLSAVVLAGVTVAGLLMLYQIRSSGNAEQSAKAVFAADAGINYRLYQIFSDPRDCAYPAPVLSNSASFDARIALEPAGENRPDNVVISSSGRAGKTFRAFKVSLGPYASSVPCLP